VARVFTREQFYELVWSKPMTHLAKEFAISDVALNKICKKHDIPNPPLGWWAKKAAGKKVKQIPLPEAKTRTADRITIASTDLGRESSALANVREQARILASEGSDDQVAPTHPIVDRTVARLRKTKPSDIGIVVADGAGLIKEPLNKQHRARLERRPDSSDERRLMAQDLSHQSDAAEPICRDFPHRSGIAGTLRVSDAQ